jgi:hypothetical protein
MLPVSTVTTERSFSTLRKLKNAMRSTITGSRRNGLALLNVHNDTLVDIDVVVNEFAGKKIKNTIIVIIQGDHVFLEYTKYVLLTTMIFLTF